MAITTTEALSRLRLLQLISPSLPVGAFTYSQGLEWSVECGWVEDEHALSQWVEGILQTGMAYVEIPLLVRLYRACAEEDETALDYWCDYLLASRETRELRDEERNRGRALASLLPELGLQAPESWQPHFRRCQLAGFAYAAQQWSIPLDEAAPGYLWGWLENSVLAGVKIIPLGQTAGQRVLADLAEQIPEVTRLGLWLDDEQIGASCTAMAIASSRHETQYTRLFRS